MNEPQDTRSESQKDTLVRSKNLGKIHKAALLGDMAKVQQPLLLRKHNVNDLDKVKSDSTALFGHLLIYYSPRIHTKKIVKTTEHEIKATYYLHDLGSFLHLSGCHFLLL
ncbi:ankyrin repeat domain-containing protein 26-like [Sarcophilus harrisii]|uniref:ankyrin repeat domain-containing protein 26-like n=1 Tax=Sarcophilus harrisii TaxID=9305 RepID=UPI001301F73E|nr:ankyrin repeat domain-containing protein 26-like [Sarcophilus harrisii]